MNSKEQMIEEITKDNFIKLTRTVIRILGDLDAAVMASEMFAENNYWESRNKLTEDGYFYSTVENVEHNTGLTRYKQQKACELLEGYGLISKKKKGIPALRYIRIEPSGLSKLLFDIELDKKKTQERLTEHREAFIERSSEPSVNDTAWQGSADEVDDKPKREFTGYSF